MAAQDEPQIFRSHPHRIADGFRVDQNDLIGMILRYEKSGGLARYTRASVFDVRIRERISA